MAIWISCQIGNILFADHQSYSPGQLQISRGADALLINANAGPPLPNNQYANKKTPWANTVNISCVRKIGTADGVQTAFPLPTDLSFVPKFWRIWTFDKGLWSDSPVTNWQLISNGIVFTTPPTAGLEIHADFGEGLQTYPESMSSNYGSPGVQILDYQTLPDYTYFAGDFKCAYQQQQGIGNVCTELTRQVVYVRPNIVVVYDRVTTTKPDFVKQVRNHAPPNIVAAVVDNQFQFVVGKSQLRVQTFSVDPIKTELATVFNSGQDGPRPVQRVSVSLATPATKARYLTVFQVLDLVTNSIPIVYIQPATVGIGNVSIAFASDGIPSMSFVKV